MLWNVFDGLLICNGLFPRMILLSHASTTSSAGLIDALTPSVTTLPEIKSDSYEQSVMGP